RAARTRVLFAARIVTAFAAGGEATRFVATTALAAVRIGRAAAAIAAIAAAETHQVTAPVTIERALAVRAPAGIAAIGAATRFARAGPAVGIVRAASAVATVTAAVRGAGTSPARGCDRRSARGVPHIAALGLAARFGATHRTAIGIAAAAAAIAGVPVG